MARWLINCKEYSQLTSKSMDRPLSFWDHLSLKIHQWICPPCSQLKEQLEAIRKACRLASVEPDERQQTEKDSIRMPEDITRKIKATLKEHLR